MMTQRQFLDTLLPLQPTLRLVAERLLGNREEAEDAVQETYARLWEQRQRLEQCENQQGFAMQMLKNHCIWPQAIGATTTAVIAMRCTT